MKLQTLQLDRYTTLLKSGELRLGALLSLTDNQGTTRQGEVAPLPKRSSETLDDCFEQLHSIEPQILAIDWRLETCFEQLLQMRLLPALSFGLESALLALLDPLPPHSLPISALLMGSPKEILDQAKLRYAEGFNSAKLKIGNLHFEEAQNLIHQLKRQFHLRIDVNRAWSSADSLHFFSQFPLDTFDYVEEPFQNPHDLASFPHPLAVDESFPESLSLEKLESLPTLKALVYKPTLQGGISHCIPIHRWAIQRGISLVLSSSFESNLGLGQIASMAYRLALTAPVGIGTYTHMNSKNLGIKAPFIQPI